jgi:hypothetical protein
MENPANRFPFQMSTFIQQSRAMNFRLLALLCFCCGCLHAQQSIRWISSDSVQSWQTKTGAIIQSAGGTANAEILVNNHRPLKIRHLF